MFLPFLFGHVEQVAGTHPEKNLEGSKASGALRHLTESKWDVGEELVPVPFICVYYPLQHPLQGLVEPLHKPICLGLVDRGPNLLDLQ